MAALGIGVGDAAGLFQCPPQRVIERQPRLLRRFQRHDVQPGLLQLRHFLFELRFAGR